MVTRLERSVTSLENHPRKVNSHHLPESFPDTLTVNSCIPVPKECGIYRWQVLTCARCVSRVLGSPVVPRLAVTLHRGGVRGAAVVGTRAARAVPHRVLKL